MVHNGAMGQSGQLWCPDAQARLLFSKDTTPYFDFSEKRGRKVLSECRLNSKLSASTVGFASLIKEAKRNGSAVPQTNKSKKFPLARGGDTSISSVL